jgi:hypothetical protein
MVVRIALQCNEADSYLILDEDNPAARLLSPCFREWSGAVHVHQRVC